MKHNVSYARIIIMHVTIVSSQMGNYYIFVSVDVSLLIIIYVYLSLSELLEIPPSHVTIRHDSERLGTQTPFVILSPSKVKGWSWSISFVFQACMVTPPPLNIVCFEFNCITYMILEITACIRMLIYTNRVTARSLFA